MQKLHDSGKRSPKYGAKIGFLRYSLKKWALKAHIVSDFTCINCAAAGAGTTFFGTTDVYEHGFPNLSICIFIDICATNRS